MLSPAFAEEGMPVMMLTMMDLRMMMMMMNGEETKQGGLLC